MNLFPKNLIRIFLAALLLTSPFLFSAWAGAPPTPMWGGFPPSENPHPPKTPAEQRRVDFAVQEIRAQYGSGVEIKFPHVIPWSYQDFLQNRKKPMPPSTPVEISGTESTSMAPVLKFDEYMVHAYVRFPNDERW
ncbi:MAG TPA: hypothetical protein DF383_12410, partial [Deltaproteobacteria bacterium]|nr:hypothetical protein [Deltaproteobacteria bacterium]